MHHLRDFRSPAIFEFFNTIGTERTWRSGRDMSVIGATADVICSERVFRLLTQSGSRPRPPLFPAGRRNGYNAPRSRRFRAFAQSMGRQGMMSWRIYFDAG
jgi:hypothetical protein